MKKTKIICSIGPASNQVEVMKQMVEAGMNVGRINFSHATEEERKQALYAIRECRKLTGKSIAILWDTKGPEFRGGVMENDGIDLVEGKTIRLVKEEVLGNAERISVNHPSAIDSLQVGNTVLLENAKMKIQVVSKEEDGVTCEIITGGHLGSRKSFSVPGIKLDIPFVGDADREDIEYACNNGGEFLALSFVSTPEDVLEVKEILKAHNREDMKIICKIESKLGIDNLEEILKVSDGAMVARGDLGTEIPSEEVPHAQKKIIKTCRKMGKIAVTATEMLETMMENARPKRAETSDIANAVLDGTDAVMLSGETTMGKHPIETVRAMANICAVAEKYSECNYISDNSNNITTAIAEAVTESADNLNAKVICAATMSGFTAQMISNLRPNAPIMAAVPYEKVGLQLALNFGVYPVVTGEYSSTDELVDDCITRAKDFTYLEQGDRVIITGGFPNTGAKTTNFMKIEEIK